MSNAHLVNEDEMREEFEAEFPVPAGVYWHDEAQRYASSCREALYKAESHRAMWKAWQAATRRALPDGFVPVPVEDAKNAERYKWLRGEVQGPHIPMAQVVWKLHCVRNSPNWTNLADGLSLDEHIDAMLQAAPRGSE